MLIHDQLNWQQLTPSTGHYFFGYYDRCAWNHDSTKHLCLSVEQCHRMPKTGETATVGYIDCGDGVLFRPVARTRAWCHQQDAMTLWLKHLQDAFVYNDFDLESNRLVSRIYHIQQGQIGCYDQPIYTISPDAQWGVSLNFSRIPRRGYSYADATLSKQLHPDLDDDGLHLINLKTGKSVLLVSYRDIISKHPMPYELDELYWWVNHAIFNCDSSKLLFLFRTCSDPNKCDNWKTHMYTVNLDGSDLTCSLPDFYWRDRMISHQIWGRTANEILIDANWRKEGSEYIVYDDRQRPFQANRISKGLGPMGHLVFSPDGQWLLADTYPVDGIQTLGVVEVATGKCTIIGRFRHEQPKGTPVDVRCDLHPKWSSDGNLITVDSIHEGYRAIFMVHFEDILSLSTQ